MLHEHLMSRSVSAPPTRNDSSPIGEPAPAFRHATLGLGDMPSTQAETGALAAGDAALRSGNLAQACVHYMQAARETPDRGEAWLGLARVLAMGGEFDRAQDLVDRAIAPEHKGKAWISLSYVFATLAEIDRAGQLVDRAITLAPDEAEAYALKAFLLQTAGDNAAALDMLRRGVECAPDDPRSWELFAAVFAQLSGPEAAIAFLDANSARVPEALSVQFLYAQLCVLTGRMEAAETRMRALVTANPGHVELAIRFAKFLTEVGEAEESIERLRALAATCTNSARPFEALADVLRGENTALPEAIANLRHALYLEPQNPTLLRSLSDCHARTARYDEAARLLALAVEHAPDARVEDDFRLGTILRNAGRLADGDRHLSNVRDRLALEIADAENDDDRSAKRAVLARVLIALGQREQALAQYAHMMRDAAGAEPWYDPDLYLPDTPGRIRRLRRLVGGRDVLVLCHGPSIAALEAWRNGFAALDVCIAALNRFRVFETGFLAASGRTVDVLLETQPKGVQPHIDQIVEFLERETPNLLITARWVMDRLGRQCPPRRAIEARFDDKLLYYGGSGGIQPATPRNPLRYVYGNSLSTLIGLMATGGARRIFLFGADGGVPHGSTATHYGLQSADFRLRITAPMRETIAASLHADAVDFRGAVETALVAVEGLFGIAAPPIFNVSPASALQVFPRITHDDAWAMLSRGLTAKRHAARP
jgi:tetratricopeptide (TPR) repeat protein